MLGKFLALVGGSAVTFALFFLMQALIASGRSAITTGEKGRVVDFVRVEREETLQRRKSKPQRPPSPEAPPPSAPKPSIDQASNVDATAVVGLGSAPVAVADVDFDIGIGLGIMAGTADGDYLPIVKIAPIYPSRALERETEGWVLLEFTVTATGAVKDVVVLECEPSTVFNSAAIKAALKFKYKPRIVNGEPIEVRGVLFRIDFSLED